MSGLALGINSQLVEINSDKHHSNCIMEYDGSDKHGITIPAMVTIVCSKKIYHMFGTG